MERKFILVLLVLLFMVGKTANATISDELTVFNDPAMFCQYQGMFGNLDEMYKEFEMLLDPPNYPNFRSMYMTVFQLLEQIRTSKTHLEMLRNSECNISKYTRMLLLYYEANKEKIEENIKDENSAQDLVTMFESIKKIVGAGFLSVMMLDGLGMQMHAACPICDQGWEYLHKMGEMRSSGAGTRCRYTIALTLMEIINTIQVLTEKLEQLKGQSTTASPSTCEGKL